MNSATPTAAPNGSEPHQRCAEQRQGRGFGNDEIVANHAQRPQRHTQRGMRAGSGEGVLHLRLHATRKGIALPVAPVSAVVLVIELREVSRPVDREEGLRC